MEKTRIFHVDMDAFFVSVEELLNPSLKGKPVVVGAQPGHRGVVAAASYEARKYGIHSAMPVSEAARRCPQAIFLPGHSGLYSKYSNRVHEILCRYSPIVEMVSIDEGYLDVTGTERMFATSAAGNAVREYAADVETLSDEAPEVFESEGCSQLQAKTARASRPRSMALDPRNLLGVSVASAEANRLEEEAHRSGNPDLGARPRHELDIQALAASSKSRPARAAHSPHLQPTPVGQPIRGRVESDYFMLSVAERLRSQILEQTGLSASIGIGTSRLVAKVASDLAKPRGIFLIAPGHEAALLAPLNIRRIPGIGPKTEKQLNNLGVTTVGDLQKLEANFLEEQFGSWGEALAVKARGGSDWRYGGDEDPKSISHENTFAIDTRDREQLESMLVYLTQRVGKRLRDHRLYASTVTLKLRDAQFKTITRAASLSEPTDLDAVIVKNALALFRDHWNEEIRIRLIGIGVSGLTHRASQGKLIDVEQSERLEKLYRAADSIRDKYGFDVLKSARGEGRKK